MLPLYSSEMRESFLTNSFAPNLKWNGEGNSSDNEANYEEYDFDDLPKEVKRAAKFLGFTSSIWDRDGKIPIESKEWDELTAAQQKAAGTIGYTQAKWDDSDSDSSSSSSESEDRKNPALPSSSVPENIMSVILKPRISLAFSNISFATSLES